jgi:outer membrane immunogenic protein
MKKTPFIVTFLIAASGLAVAAGMPVKAPAPIFGPNFSGWYFGVNAGVGWGSTDPNFNIDDSTGRYFTFGASQNANIRAVVSAGNSRLDNSTFTGGVQLGRLWQTGAIVYGFEWDIEYFNPKGSSSVTGTLPPPAFALPGGPVFFTVNNSVSGSWLSTARARGGVAYQNWLLYGTFGAAFANVRFSSTYADTTTAPPQLSATLVSSFSSTKFLWGLAAGAGAEYAVTPNWSVRGEYLYVRLNPLNGSTVALPTVGLVPPAGACPPSGSGFCSVFNYGATVQEHFVRAALNYKFSNLNWP